jgi:hypothetical protein
MLERSNPAPQHEASGNLVDYFDLPAFSCASLEMQETPLDVSAELIHSGAARPRLYLER